MTPTPRTPDEKGHTLQSTTAEVKPGGSVERDQNDPRNGSLPTPKTIVKPTKERRGLNRRRLSAHANNSKRHNYAHLFQKNNRRQPNDEAGTTKEDGISGDACPRDNVAAIGLDPHTHESTSRADHGVQTAAPTEAESERDRILDKDNFCDADQGNGNDDGAANDNQTRSCPSSTTIDDLIVAVTSNPSGKEGETDVHGASMGEKNNTEEFCQNLSIRSLRMRLRQMMCTMMQTSMWNTTTSTLGTTTPMKVELLRRS